MSIAGTADTEYPATNSVDLRSALDDLGAGENLFVVILINTAVEASGGAANVTFAVVDADDAALSSPVRLVVSDAIAKETLVAGYRLVVAVPNTAKRYLGVTFTPDKNNTTGGTFSAFLVKDFPVNTVFPAGSEIL